MKKLILLLLTLCTYLASNATDFVSKRSGDFNDKTNWTPSSRVPGPGDNATIREGHDMTLTDAVTLNNLTIDDKSGSENTTNLIIENTGALTLTGNFTMICDNPRNYLSPDYLGVVFSQLLIYGSLDVQGNFTMTNTSYINSIVLGLLEYEYIGSNQVVVGSTTSAGSLTIGGDLNLGVNTSIPALQQNTLAIGNGTVTFGKMLNLTSNDVTGQALDNYIFFYDQGGYSGLHKDVYFTQNGNPFNFQQGVLTSQSSSDYSNTVWHFNSSSSNNLIVDDRFYFGVLSIESPIVTLGSNLTENNVLGKVIVRNGATLVVDNPTATMNGITGANKVELDAGGTLKLKNAGIPNGLPSNSVLNANANSLIDFEVSSGQNYNVITSTGTYPKVTLSGSGTKTISSSSPDIDNSALRVGELQLNKGTLVLEDGVMLHLNNSYGNKRFQLDSATTLKIQGIADIDAYADINRYNTTEFNASITQSLFALTNEAAETEPYGILKLTSGTGSALAKNLDAKELLVANRLTLGSNVNLNLNQDGFIHLVSGNVYTAYVSEVPGNTVINYNGSGNFIVDKYFQSPGYSAPDLSHPLKGATLNNYNQQGFQMRGFPGSNKPGNKFSSVSTYTESELGSVNTGFNKPASITDAFIVKDAGGLITRSTYRVNVDPLTKILSDTGAINTGNHTFKITFNFSNTGENSRIENDGFNLIGNPFPANLDWKKVVNDPANKALFDNGYLVPYVYVYKYFDRVAQEPTGTSGYGYFNPITNFQYAQDSIIPSHQGFWVKAYHPTSTSETYELTIRESHKINFEESRNYKNKAKAKNTKDIAAKISLESNGKIDEIFFHSWAKATTFYDKTFDISSFGAKSASQPFIDFIGLDKKQLDLYVNAVDQDLRGDSLPIYLNIPSAGTHILKLSNLSYLLKDYGCSYLLDRATGEKISLKNTTSYTFTADVYTGIRFVIKFSKNLSDDVTTENLSCNNANDGKVELDLSPINHNSFSLFYEGTLLKSFVGFYDKVSASNLKPGFYELVNNLGLMTCSSNKLTFEIENKDALKATIQKSSDSIFVNDRVTFTTTSNAAVFNWVLNGTNYPGEVFAYTFPAPGTYTIALQYADALLNCSAETSEDVIVQELATGITTLTSTEGVLVKGGILQVDGGTDFTQVFIYNLNGQLLDQKTINSQAQNIVLPLGTSIIHLLKDNGTSQSFKIGNF